MTDVNTINQSFCGAFGGAVSELEDEYGSDKLKTLFEIEGISSDKTDIAQFTHSFLQSEQVADYSVDPNANVSEQTVEQFPREAIKPHLRINAINTLCERIHENYTEEDAKRIVKKLITGELFINDLDKLERSYCWALTLDKMCSEGIPFVTDDFEVEPPKHSRSFVALTIQMVSYISNHIAGALSLPTFLVDLDYFYRKELGDDYREHWYKHKDLIENQFQNFIYSVNWPFRSGQSPFTNVSIFDRVFLESLFADYTYPDLSNPNYDSVDFLQRRFAEYFDRIFGNEGMFTFPVITLALAVDNQKEIQDQEFLNWACEVNADKGLFNIYAGPTTSLSSCCRLRNEIDGGGSLGYTNSFGSASLNIGSHRVAGLNMPRLAHRSQTEDKDMEELVEEDTRDVHKILLTHRKFLQDEIDRGLQPLYDNGWINLSRQYSTVGFVGAYEALEILGMDMHEDSNYYLDILQQVSSINREKEKETDIPFNIEQIPAESVAVRSANKDQTLYEFDDYYRLYSNQYFPLIDDAPLASRIKMQGKFDEQTSGGAILHINLTDGADLTKELMSNLIDRSVHEGCQYFAINLDFVECEQGHINTGKTDACVECGADIVERYTRPVGFITPVSGWEQTRRRYEYDRRHRYDAETAEIEVTHE